MAKEKGKGQKRVTNKHLHARIEYLRKAAVYLAGQPDASLTSQIEGQNTGCSNSKSIGERTEALSSHQSCELTCVQPVCGGLSARLVEQLRQVAKKSTIRLDQSTKRSLCKRCNAVMQNSNQYTEHLANLSRNGQKPQADVLIRQCAACGAPKRFPVGATRQLRKSSRPPKPASRDIASAS